MPVPIKLLDVQRVYHKVGEADIHYEISDSDESGDPKYYGYLAANGAWVIMKLNETAGTYRYIAGGSLYTANWTARAGLTYVYYYALGV